MVQFASAQPMSASGSPSVGELPVEHHADLVVDEHEVAGLRVAVHEGDGRDCSGFWAINSVSSRSSAGAGPRCTRSSHRPVLELTVEEVQAVAQEPEARLLRIDAVDRRDLLDHATPTSAAIRWRQRRQLPGTPCS